jgi:signal transduction histidine kinase
MVAQSYSNYIAWKDSTDALKHADEISDLKKQIADNEATIADKDSSLSTRWFFIIGLCILAAALAAALVIGAIILMRFILLDRKQKKTIRLANESNALKAKFISNISAQLEPTFKKLDSKQPEVKALLGFSSHIQTLSELENKDSSEIELEDIPVQQFCEDLMDQIRDKVKSEVNLLVNASNMSAKINREYVSHILLHLLNNAAEYTPEEGSITLDFKKRGPHTYQFLVSDTGCGIPEEKREDIFKPFLEIRDLTTGDGLGLPICKQMALKMNGDLDIDPKFTKGTRFVLDLHL